ncbi:MAG TPA: thioredoxin domain-containing protein [Vicinamibacterales bacterium]|nr:thioredoxin domain-containing protein [Vicinamibacterales bacterium]
MPNRLASQASPYLLQHKDNPVDWYPWGNEAFALSRQNDKPIFLSIGYSTCHWCHVMEHESFEDPALAELLNRHFVSIKVDREERPDVDRVYMTFVQATTGSGGWPMSVWLTPSLQPFYGGTYFPPTSRWGKPGFAEVLEEIARVWREERDKVNQSAANIVERLRTFGAQRAGGDVPSVAVLERATAEFTAIFDTRRGGFGNAPKFPRPSELLFLLREHARTGAGESRDMALLSLRAMALGGMRDHIGGGFHRYSVDADWRVPHFEKMLYDQAQLTLAYVEAGQLTGDRFFSDVAIDTLAYVRRDLTDKDGGFYSAEDADSIPPEHASEPDAHKMEGAFYVWTEEEIRAVLGVDAEIFCQRFGVKPGGNAPFDPQNEFANKNLLYTARPLADVQQNASMSALEVVEVLEGARRALFERRATRPRPHLDDKVLTAWNGLMIAAFARVARAVEGAEEFLDDATRAARFVRRHLWNPQTGTVLRRYRQGDADVDGYAEDYAYLIFGLLELFQAGGDPEWLEWALQLQERQDALFWDPVDGGWFSTTGKDPSVLLRLKEDYDGAEPAASSVSVLNLQTLAHLFPDDSRGFDGKISQTLGAFASRAGQMGRSVPMMLAALSTYHAGVPQVVIAGDPQGEDTLELKKVLRAAYMPTAIVITVLPQHREALARLLPWVASMKAVDGHATAYVCRDFACQIPATSAGQLEDQLRSVRLQPDRRPSS